MLLSHALCVICIVYSESLENQQKMIQTISFSLFW